MSHDFARSHRLKKESSARKPTRKKKKSGVPSWLWVLVGTLVGCLIMFLVYLSGVAPQLKPPSAQQAASSAGEAGAETKSSEPPAPPKRVSPVFEFYTKLPDNGGQSVTDIAAKGEPAQAPAEAKPADGTPATASPANLDPIQQLLAEKEAAKAKTAEVAKTEAPKPEDVKPEAAKVETAKTAPAKTEIAKTEAAKATTAKPEPAKSAPAKTEAAKGRYLQAGAFRNKAEVDKLRAKITLLGLTPSVQTSTNAKGETLQRVMVGPFSDATKMKDAQIILGGNGVNTIPTR
jgi:cell division protein FtsN